MNNILGTNNVYETFSILLTLIFIMKNIVTFFYIRIIPKTRWRDKGSDFLPSKCFWVYDNHWLFWSSILWLLVYYQEPITEWCKQCLR